jgi:hypothetical protein
MTDQEFLSWIADRLVYVYRESPNVDFVRKLRQIASAEPLTFPPIDTTAIPEKPSVIAAKRLKLERFEYVERS